MKDTTNLKLSIDTSSGQELVEPLKSFAETLDRVLDLTVLEIDLDKDGHATFSLRSKEPLFGVVAA